MKNVNDAKYIKWFPFFTVILILILIRSDYLPESLTSRLNDRLGEDTRSEVFENFFNGMEDDMFFGKGMNGIYFSPVDALTLEDGAHFQEETNRNVIKNGFLQFE